MAAPDTVSKTTKRKPDNTLEKKASLFQLSSIAYGVMMAIGFGIVAWGHNSLAQVFAIPENLTELGRLIAIGGLGAGLLLVLSYFFEDWFASYRDLKSAIMRLLGPCSVPMAFYLALVSAIGEEVLFRGAIQPFAGLVVTSILFGLLHLGQDGRISAWSVWAVVAGLLLGWMFQETGSLWPPIIAHFLVNSISILRLRHSYKNYLAVVNTDEKPEP